VVGEDGVIRPLLDQKAVSLWGSKPQAASYPPNADLASPTTHPQETLHWLVHLQTSDWLNCLLLWKSLEWTSAQAQNCPFVQKCMRDASKVWGKQKVWHYSFFLTLQCVCVCVCVCVVNIIHSEVIFSSVFSQLLYKLISRYLKSNT